MSDSFVNKDLIYKYSVRFCHMFTVSALSGKAIFEYIYGTYTDISQSEAIFSAVLGIILIVSGLINTFLQKPNEHLKDHKAIWMRTLYVKFFVSILVLTPIPKLIGFSREVHVAMQFYIIVIFLIISPLLKFYREYYTEYNRQRKFSYENMEILK